MFDSPIDGDNFLRISFEGIVLLVLVYLESFV